MTYFNKITTAAARAFALIGGVVLLLMVVMTIISVIGRGINAYGLGPIPGDFELVEFGSAFVIFWILPWAQIKNGHVAVDVLARHFPKMLNRTVAVISQMLIVAMAFYIARQLTLGFMDKLNYGEMSFILMMPVWWGYLAALPGAYLWVVAAIVTLTEAVRGCEGGHEGGNEGGRHDLS